MLSPSPAEHSMRGHVTSPPADRQGAGAACTRTLPQPNAERSQGFLGRATGAAPKHQLVSISPTQPKQLVVERISSMFLLRCPHSTQAPARQDAACILACLTSKPTSKPKVTSRQGATCPAPAAHRKACPSCTCISGTAPSHPKTRSHTPHRRGTGLCAAARPPAGSRQACRLAGTPPACPAQRRGYRPGGRKRNTSGVAGERKWSEHARCTGGSGASPRAGGTCHTSEVAFPALQGPPAAKPFCSSRVIWRQDARSPSSWVDPQALENSMVTAGWHCPAVS